MDPQEFLDVAARHPDVLKDFAAALARWKAKLPARYEKGLARDNRDGRRRTPAPANSGF